MRAPALQARGQQHCSADSRSAQQQSDIRQGEKADDEGEAAVRKEREATAVFTPELKTSLGDDFSSVLTLVAKGNTATDSVNAAVRSWSVSSRA